MSEKHEVFKDGSISIHEAGVCDIYEIGSWYSYLDGDEDLVYTYDKNSSHSYSYDFIRLDEDGYIAGYSVGYPKNAISSARPDALYDKEYFIVDFSVDLEDRSASIASVLMDYVMRRAAKYGCDRIAIEKKLPEYTVFYSFLENLGAAFSDGRYTIEIPYTDKEKYKYAIPSIEGEISREISYQLLALDFVLGEKEASRPLNNGYIKINRLTGDVIFESVGFKAPSGLNVNNTHDIAMVDYLISCAREEDNYEYNKTYNLHGKEVFMADLTWQGGFAGIVIYGNSNDETAEISKQFRYEYSTSLHALYKAGYNAVMLFTVSYDAESESFTESSTMIPIEAGFQKAVEYGMERVSGNAKKSLKERIASRKRYGKPTKIRLEFGKKSAWFMMSDDANVAKLDGKTKELSDEDVKRIAHTVQMLALGNWSERYEGKGEKWMLAIEFNDGASFISMGIGDYPPAFPLALDLYYDYKF